MYSEQTVRAKLPDKELGDFRWGLHCPVAQEIWIPLAAPRPPPEDAQPRLTSHGLKDLLWLFAV